MKSNRWLPVLLLGGILAVLIVGKLAAESKDDNVGLEVGNVAPNFEVEKLDGETLKLSDLQGQPVMLNFWATWCPPCRSEMPDMQKLHENNDVVVLAINLTDTEMNEKAVSKFVDEYGLQFPIGLDSDGAIASTYRINPIPTTFMIDSRGKIRHKSFGAMEYKQMVEELEKIK